MNEKMLNERHQQMLILQERIKPFTPTMRDLLEAWKVSSTNTVSHTLRQLERHGMAQTRRRGKHTAYYAVQGAQATQAGQSG